MERFLQEIENSIWLGNSLLDYLLCLATIVTGFGVIHFFNEYIFNKILRYLDEDHHDRSGAVLRVVRQSFIPLIYIAILYFALQGLSLPVMAIRGFGFLTAVGVTIFLVHFSTELVRVTLEYYASQSPHSIGRTNFMGILTFSKLILWGIGTVFLLDNFGFKISTIIAGLGIGGVAFAFAAQAILKDLFGYFVIFFDRPFDIGDFIIVGDMMGNVEHIGMKTTRIRSLNGEEIIFANSDLTDSRVRNIRKMEERRVAFELAVTYDTPQAALCKIPEELEKLICATEDCRFERATFLEYGEHGMIFEIVYHVLGNKYLKYTSIQHRINMEIHACFEKLGVHFALPVRALYEGGSTKDAFLRKD